jgi:hypothetical protein
MGKFLTTEQFIEKAIKIHGNKYDYSKVEYKRSREKVCIICPEHGEFWQTPNEHLSGYGCKKCAVELTKKKETKTNDEFIKEARKVHNNRYDYSKVNYKGSHVKVCIICPIHGEFWQTPANHLMGKGCKKCAQISLWDRRGRKTTKSIVEEFKTVHGNKYDYSKVEYSGNKAKVCIICPEHGEFWQTPAKHLSGQGCPECGKKLLWDRRGRITTNEFIKRAKEVHGDKYDYSKVDYKRRDSKVCIICPEHGEFLQTPAKHLEGQECPECNNRMNKEECILWRKLQKKYPDMVITHEYHNTQILGKKSIDIFFEGKNIGVEYQGGQHFKPIKMFGGYNGFLKIAKRDKEKYEICKRNNIRLFYYTRETWNALDNYIDKVYTKFDELCSEIDKILENWN